MNNRWRRRENRHKLNADTLFHLLAGSCVTNNSIGSIGARFSTGACVSVELGCSLIQDPLEFIPGWLDDLGLPSNQFRILCHISRRGSCFASLSSIAKTTKLTRKTVQECISVLLARGLIFKQSRLGKTSIYSRTPSPKGVLSQVSTRVNPRTGTQGDPGTEHLGQSTYYEGSKTEGSPNKGERPLSSFEDWQLNKDEKALSEKIARLKEATIVDQELVDYHIQCRRAIRDEQRRRGKDRCTPLP